MIWGVKNFTLRMSILSTHEAVFALVSWFLCYQFLSKKDPLRFNNTNSFLLFVILEIFIPICVNSIYVYHSGFVKGDLDKVALYWLSAFITILPIAIASLYFFEFSAEKRKLILHADRFLLQVALSNLLSNAIKYPKKLSDQDPYVKILSYTHDGFFVLDILDNGEGIREEYKSRLFNMFYCSTGSSSGSGLGLYIAKEAIQKMEGQIAVSSTWREGSVFTILLPIVQS